MWPSWPCAISSWMYAETTSCSIAEARLPDAAFSFDKVSKPMGKPVLSPRQTVDLGDELTVLARMIFSLVTQYPWCVLVRKDRGPTFWMLVFLVEECKGTSS